MAYTSMAMSLIASPEASGRSEYGRFINTIRAAPLSVCKEVIGLIKREIKSKGCPPTAKLRALKLLHACMLTGNNEFLLFASKKLMQRFTIMGRYKRQSMDDNRGADMFGPQSTGSTEHMQASAEFLRTLLSSMKIWAQQFGQGPDGQPSPFLKAYKTLEREGVQFPEGEGKGRRNSQPAAASLPRGNLPFQEDRLRRPRPGENKKELEAVRSSAALLKEMIGTGQTDRETLQDLADTLRTQVTQLEVQINNQAALPQQEAEVQAMLDVNDSAREALEQYDRTKMRASISLPQRPKQPSSLLDFDAPKASDFRTEASASLNPRNPFLSLRPSAAPQEWQERPLPSPREGDLQAEVARLREQVKQHQSDMERLQKKYEIRLAEMENRYKEELKRVQEEGVVKDSELRVLRATLEDLKAEYRRLRVPPPDPVPLRLSVSSSSSNSLSNEETLTNEAELPALWHANSGKLLDCPFLQVGFKMQVQGSEARVMLYVGNKSTSYLEQLVTTLECSDNLEATVDKEEELAPVAPRSKADRMLRFKVSEFYADMPKLLVKCLVERREVRALVTLPVPMWRFLASPQANPSQVWGIWTSLEASSMLIRFKRLRCESIAVLTEALACNFQVLSRREVPELEAAILACGRKDTSVLFLRFADQFGSGVAEMRSNYSKLAEASAALLPVLLIDST
jgi:hypothetical protein